MTQNDQPSVCRLNQREELAASERRSAVLVGEIEELRAQIDILEKTRKMVEGELHEAADRISDLTAANSSLTAAKKKLETDLQALHVSITLNIWHKTITMAVICSLLCTDNTRY